MDNINGITLNYRVNKRDNYMSVSDLSQDLTTDSLIALIPTFKEMKKQLVIMSEIESRNEISEDRYFELLETCNGI